MLQKDQKQRVKNKMTNTERPTTKSESKKQGIMKQPKVETPKITQKIEEKKEIENKKEEASKEKAPEKKVQKKAPKKTEVIVNCPNLPISTKYAMALCKFIKNKTIDRAISDLQQVLVLKKPVPMKGEIAHRKGKIMSGRFPVRASKYFIKTLKGLKGNVNNHELDDTIIVEAIANIGERPYGRFGSVRRKRTHLKIIAKEKKMLNKNKGEKNGRKKNS